MFNIYGGKFLGSGSYKCVYSPPLLCNVPLGSQPFDITQAIDYAGAVMEAEHADEEMQEVEKIMQIDPTGDFTLQPTAVCDIDRKNIQKYPSDLENKKLRGINPFDEKSKCHIKNIRKQLIYYMGGYNLENMRINHWARGGPKIVEFLRAFYNVIYGIKKINESGYLHNDLKALNILYNYKTNEFKIIDFGFLCKMSDIYQFEPAHNILINGERYFVWSPDIALSRDIADYIKTYHKSPPNDFVLQSISRHKIPNITYKDEEFYFVNENRETFKQNLKEFLKESSRKMDVYSLGSVMYNLFKIDSDTDYSADAEFSNIHFYLKDINFPGLSELITVMMHPIPFLRPSIQEVEVKFIDIVNSMSSQKFNLSTIKLVTGSMFVEGSRENQITLSDSDIGQQKTVIDLADSDSD